MLTVGVMMFAWWGAAIAAPAVLAARALRRGKWAMKMREFGRAQRHFERAAQRDDLREEAVCLMAEAALHEGRPQDAIMALDDLMHTADGVASRRAVFLRGVACCGLRQGISAHRTLAELADRDDASSEETLAMVHACIQAEDFTAARVLLNAMPEETVGGPLNARLQLCRAAMAWHDEKWSDVLRLLPDPDACSDADRRVVKTLRRLAGERQMHDLPI